MLALALLRHLDCPDEQSVLSLLLIAAIPIRLLPTSLNDSLAQVFDALESFPSAVVLGLDIENTVAAACGGNRLHFRVIADDLLASQVSLLRLPYVVPPCNQLVRDL